MKLSERLDKAAHDMDATQETRNTAWAARDLLAECEKVLAFYADDKNWYYNSELDPCSANFKGGPARATLEKLRAQENADE